MNDDQTQALIKAIDKVLDETKEWFIFILALVILLLVVSFVVITSVISLVTAPIETILVFTVGFLSLRVAYLYRKYNRKIDV